MRAHEAGKPDSASARLVSAFRHAHPQVGHCQRPVPQWQAGFLCPRSDTSESCVRIIPSSEGAAGYSPIPQRRVRVRLGKGIVPAHEGENRSECRIPGQCRGWPPGSRSFEWRRPMVVFPRILLLTASSRGVLVFHAFVKKTQRTPPLEIELARKRLKELFDA